MKRLLVRVALLCGLTVLAGCTALPSTGILTPGPTSIPSARSSASPTSSASVWDDPSYVPETIESDECHDWVFAARTDPEQVSGWALQIPVDGGPQEYAMGTATLDENGTPAAYTVAPGDIDEFVADRFCINLGYLYAINAVRRWEPGFYSMYIGDTINLDAHTIFTVGDQNGNVTNGPAPDPIPPQH